MMPTLSGADEPPEVPAVGVPPPAFDPIAAPAVPDGFDVDGLAVAVPATPPTLVGVLVVGVVVEVWPAMLASPVALLLL